MIPIIAPIANPFLVKVLDLLDITITNTTIPNIGKNNQTSSSRAIVFTPPTVRVFIFNFVSFLELY